MMKETLQTGSESRGKVEGQKEIKGHQRKDLSSSYRKYFSCKMHKTWKANIHPSHLSYQQVWMSVVCRHIIVMLVFRRNSERRKDIYCFARYTSPATGRSSFISNFTPRFFSAGVRDDWADSDDGRRFLFFVEVGASAIFCLGTGSSTNFFEGETAKRIKCLDTHSR